MLVNVKGTFMGATINTRKGQNGQPDQHSIQVDVYQPDSTAMNKAIQVKVPDITALTEIQNKYKMGAPVEFAASVRAYNGNIYLTHESGLVKSNF